MKKIIFIFLSVIIALFIVYKNNDKYIKTNKVYTKNIDLTQDVSKITIDNTRIIEKSKEILSDIYEIEDFSKFRIESGFGDNVFYVYFYDNKKDGYFISYNIDKGFVVSLNRLLDNKAVSGDDMNLSDELEEIIREDLNKLEVSNLANYEMISCEYNNNYLNIKLTNKLTQKDISITVNPYTGELMEYDFSKININK